MGDALSWAHPSLGDALSWSYSSLDVPFPGDTLPWGTPFPGEYPSLVETPQRQRQLDNVNEFRTW